jgi:hypothetical protein
MACSCTVIFCACFVQCLSNCKLGFSFTHRFVPFACEKDTSKISMCHLRDLHKNLRYGGKIFQLVQEVDHAMLPHKKARFFCYIQLSSTVLLLTCINFIFLFSPDPKIQSMLSQNNHFKTKKKMTSKCPSK